MLYAVLTIREQSVIRQERYITVSLKRVSLTVQSRRITGYITQAYTTNGTYLRTEVPAQQFLTETYALKYLGTTI